jgi:hypothetical protein
MTLLGTIENVSPDQAKEWLGNVRNQAKRDMRLVKSYANDMIARRWKLNGEPIILSESGQLLSGRLRLQAAVDGNVSFPSLVIRGVPDAYFETIDAVRRRTMSDILTIRKEPNGRALGAALATVWRYGSGWNTRQNSKVSAQQLLAVLEANPEIRTSLLVTRDCSPAIPLGLACAAHYLFSCVDSSKANAFFQQFVSKSEEPTPPIKLRKTLLELREQGGARSQAYMLAVTIKAWEAFRSDRPVLHLRYGSNEEFPRISDLPANLALDGATIVKSSVNNNHEVQDVSEIKISVVTVIPEEAATLLSHNDGNRRIAPPVVQRYKRDMINGHWQLNGQTIKIGNSGRLLDGQHRLAACVEAEVPFTAVLVRGLDDSVFDTFDLGAKRSLADVLIDRGEINTSTLAATLRQLWLLQKGLLQTRVVNPSVAEMLELLEAEPGIRRSVSLANRIRDISAPSLACALHYLFAERSPDRADEFIGRLADGVALEARSPILVLREKLIRDKSTKKRSMADPEKAALFIKAWNAFRTKVEVQSLRWMGSGPKREPFPEVL